jgi:hypothetical protein
VGAVLQVLLPTHGPIAVQNPGLNNPMARMMAQSVGIASTAQPPANVAERSLGIETTAKNAAGVMPIAPSNVQLLGASLYSQYSLSLELAGILLTIALVGSVVIARKNVDVQQESLGTGKVPSE